MPTNGVNRRRSSTPICTRWEWPDQESVARNQ
jgi:hypothetical protein